MQTKLLLLLILTAPLIVIAQPKFSINEDVGEISRNTYRYELNCDRAAIIADYEEGFLGTHVTSEELAWTGNVDLCDAGEISDLALERVRQRINYFRRLVGVHNGVIFSEEKNAKCQEAVLMMQAAGLLDHYPTADWECATDDGIQAAGKSNLSYGGHSAASVPQYIRDAGTHNGPVGHRRWILFPRAHEFGFGSSTWGTAMWVIGGNQNPESYPEFVAYPSPGYFPKNLTYPRWSFSKRGANFTESGVNMIDENGRSVELYQEEVVNGFGDNTIVWVPEVNIYDNENGTDQFFEVTIDSVKVSGEYLSFTYEVLLADVEYREPIASITHPSCGDSSGSIILDIPTGYKSIEWVDLDADHHEVEGLPAGTYEVSVTDKLNCTQSFAFVLEDKESPVDLTAVNGEHLADAGSTSVYSVDNTDNGSYAWSVVGGEILLQSNNEVEVLWDLDETEGKVCVTYTSDEGCESNQVCLDVELLTSSIEDLDHRSLVVSPNPVFDKLMIKLQSHSFSDILVRDIHGSTIYSKSFPVSNVQELDLSSLNSGIYLLTITSKHRSFSKKIVKL